MGGAGFGSEPAWRARCLTPVAGLEQSAQVGIGNPAATVRDREHGAPVGHLTGHRDRTVARRVSDGVHQQVGQDPAHLSHIDLDLGGVVGVAVEQDALGAGERIRGGDGIGDDITERDALQRQLKGPGVEPGQLEQVVDHRGEAFTGAHHGAVVAGHGGGVGDHPVVEGLGGGADAGDRRAQVVADPRDQLAPAGFQRPLPFPGRDQPDVGVVQRTGDRRELCRRRRRPRRSVTVLTKVAGRIGEGHRCPGHRASEPERRCGRGHRGHGEHDEHDIEIVVGEEHRLRGSGDTGRHRADSDDDHRRAPDPHRCAPQHPQP